MQYHAWKNYFKIHFQRFFFFVFFSKALGRKSQETELPDVN